MLWTIDPLDWCSKSSTDVEKRILSKARENAIILLHDEYASSIEAALFIVDELQSQGYVFVTVEEIMLVSWNPQLDKIQQLDEIQHVQQGK